MNKIENRYNIYVDMFISDIDKHAKVFPENSAHLHSSPINNNGAVSQQETLIKNIPKNRSEIPFSYYRNGILEKDALLNFIKNDKLYVGRGEYSVCGSINFLNYTNSYEYLVDEPEVASLGTLENSNIAKLSYISSSIFKRKKYSYIPIATGLEGAAGLSYSFNPSDLEEIIINNYVSVSGMDKYYLKPTNINYGVSTEEEFTNLAELLGYADGSFNQVFKTKYFPVSKEGPADLNIQDNLTRVVVDNNGVYTQYNVYDGYLTAEKTNIPNSCFLDRSKGKIYFAKETFPSGETVTLNTNILGGSQPQTIEIPYSIGLKVADEGFIKITQSGNPLATENTAFRKIDNTRIEIEGTGFSYSSPIIISACEKLSRPIGNVYCFYTPVLPIQSEIKDTDRTLLSREIKPWLWSNQQTIAVIGRDKAYPYKITLKAIDVPFMGILGGERYTYGPISSSTELILLEGMVTTEDNEPVGNQEVEVFIQNGMGKINGENTALVVTNDSGKFYCTYEPTEGNLKWLIFKDNDIVRYGGKTKLIVNPAYNETTFLQATSSTPMESVLYGIVKNDGLIGTVGKKVILNKNVESTPAELTYKRFIDLSETQYSSISNRGFFIFDEMTAEQAMQYIGGIVTLKMLTLPSLGEYVTYNYTIKDVVSYADAWYSEGSEQYEFPKERHALNTFLFILDNNSHPVADNVLYIEKAWLMANNEKKFSAVKMNGKKVAFIKGIGGQWKHPNVPFSGLANGVLLTSSYDSSGPSFETDYVVPESSSTDREIDIAGYALIPQVNAIVQAKCLSDDTYIYSNLVSFLVSLDSSHRGIISDTLNQIKVPYGFRFWDTNSEQASYLDGEVFLTVNNIAGSSIGINKYPLISYVNSNGIIYLGDTNQPKPYKNYPVSLGLSIEIKE